MNHDTNTSETREEWLNAAAGMLRTDFAAIGYTVPTEVRCSVGFPSTGRLGKRIGECWYGFRSADGHNEIFIRPDQADPIDVLAILTHELIHATVESPTPHGHAFRKAALAIGLAGPMRSTIAGPHLTKRLHTIADTIGPFPHAALDFSKRKKQTTRLLKAACNCGYVVRIARSWLDARGAPWCPDHGAMRCDAT